MTDISPTLAFEMGKSAESTARMRDATKHSNDLGSVAVLALTGLASRDADIDGHCAVKEALISELAKLAPNHPLVCPLKGNPARAAIFDRAHDEWLAKNKPGLFEQLKSTP